MELLYKRIFETHETNHYFDSNPITSDKKEYSVNDFESKSIPKNRNIGKWMWKSDSKHKDEYMENYGNPLTSVLEGRYTIVIEKNDEKVSLKVFYVFKNRRVGGRFFKKQTSLDFITFRYKDGAVFYGKMINYHLKRKSRKIMRRFVFGQSDILNKMFSVLREIYGVHWVREQSKENVDEHYSTINLFVNEVSNKSFNVKESLQREVFYETILEKQGVKYPNNYMAFIRSSYPTVTKKDSKKFDGKFIDTFMKVRGLSGKKIKRVLHTIEHFSKGGLSEAINIFGVKYLMGKSDEELKKIIETGNNITGNFIVGVDSLVNKMGKIERDNFFSCYMLSLGNDSLIDTMVFNDHLGFLFKLKRFEDVKWGSYDYQTFSDEHEQWSDKVSSYENGTFTRIYNEVFIEQTEQVILGVDNTYHPKVLMCSDDYNKESGIQHNCVRTYVKSVKSLIISLRKDSKKSSERATIEYSIRVDDDNESLYLTRVQTLGKFNHRLDESWNSPIAILDDRVYTLVSEGLFNTLRLSVEFKGGVEESDYTINDYGGVNWSNENIQYVGSRYRHFGGVEVINENLTLDMFEDLPHPI